MDFSSAMPIKPVMLESICGQDSADAPTRALVGW